MKRQLTRFLLLAVILVAAVFVYRLCNNNPADLWVEPPNQSARPYPTPPFEVPESSRITFDLTTPEAPQEQDFPTPASTSLLASPEGDHIAQLPPTSVPTPEVITGPAVQELTNADGAPAPFPVANLMSATITHATLGAVAVEHPRLFPMILANGQGMTDCVNAFLGYQSPPSTSSPPIPDVPLDLFLCLETTYAPQNAGVWFRLPSPVRNERIGNLIQDYWTVKSYSPQIRENQLPACYDDARGHVSHTAAAPDPLTLAQRYLHARHQLDNCILPAGTALVLPAPESPLLTVKPTTPPPAAFPFQNAESYLITSAAMIMLAESEPKTFAKALTDSAGLSHCIASVPVPTVQDPAAQQSALAQYQVEIVSCLNSVYLSVNGRLWFGFSQEERERPFRWIVADSWQTVIALSKDPLQEPDQCYRAIIRQIPRAASRLNPTELAQQYLSFLDQTAVCERNILNGPGGS